MTVETTQFNEILWQFYAAHGRYDLPWRQPATDGSFDPYKILVSEVMLQQTQVRRVLPKFDEFLMKFPTVHDLASSSLGEVLKIWSGLGYNRRAKFLWQAAQEIIRNHDGRFSDTVAGLVALPGIGKNTAGAIMAYAFNEPALFIETNIRTAYIHHFFNDQIDVADAAIMGLLEQTLDRENPREFYWALMDYGSFLKQTVGNVAKFSKVYAKQSAFQGSRRQIRGKVLRLLTGGELTITELANFIPDDRLEAVLADLVNEGLIKSSNMKFHV